MGSAAAVRLPGMLADFRSLFLVLALLGYAARAQPGFVSIDCGSTDNYTDDLGITWASDAAFPFGYTANVSAPPGTRRPLTTLRYFPADTRKYCYTLPVKNRTRYLLRASFLYGNFDSSNVYPKFDLSLGATHWSTIVIDDTGAPEVRELIFLASAAPTVSVCVSKATTGMPFISSLELRQFNGSLYFTDFETQFYLAVSARINFGAATTDPVRYPDDPFDRIWESDSIRRANYLVGVAPGTIKVSTRTPVFVDGTGTTPPSKVMQTAVVGSEGSLTYRLNLNGFPGFGWAFSYFAEIEDLAPNETRKFRLVLQGSDYLQLSKAVVDVQENAQGKYRLYEPGYPNISFPFVFPFEFRKTNESTRGPILNAIEISKYLPINSGSPDATTMSSFVSHYSSQGWAQEGGDPCLPVPWSWLQCSTDALPRITSINLSRRNLGRSIPSEIMMLTGLVELWLDGNSLTGDIPDLSGCVNLQKIHLENNKLSGDIPSSLAELQSLKELYVQNNMLTGKVPGNLLDKDIDFKYSGNMNLRKGKSRPNLIIIVTCAVGGVFVLLLAAFAYCWLSRREKKKLSEQVQNELKNNPPTQKLYSFFTEVGKETSNKFTLSELEEATGKFGKRVGSGGYGVVYYGKMKDGKEIAVKVLTSESYQGNREFSNEVALLSRIHHRNLVTFLGFCQQDGKNILVYEFMHNGTLKEHLYGPAAQERTIGWLKRLEISEDAAKGIEYLHTGCTPSIIHRDVKSSNILLDKHMRAKVSDFGLSKLAVDGSSHVSSVVRGTVGYLDPEYYISQQLTDKSDVYSFGVILLELISGQEAISNERFGINCRNIVQWAKSHIESGNIQGIIDPSLGNDFNIQSVWKIAEKAISCVQPHGIQRPTISEVLKEIQEAISIERGSDSSGEGDLETLSKHSTHSSFNVGTVYLGEADKYTSFSDSAMLPAAR